MDIKERQQLEVRKLESEIESIEIDAGGWGDYNPEIAKEAEPLRVLLEFVKRDPKEYFRLIDDK